MSDARDVGDLLDPLNPPIESDPAPLGGRAISLALQGGASLGAYTWGVLDGILEDGRLEIEGVTGASAGAINAAALGVGYALDGRRGARDRLERFWVTLAQEATRRRRTRLGGMLELGRRLRGVRASAGFYRLTTRLVADFEIEPESMEPLRGVLERTLDLARLADDGAIRVFVNVTDVRTGNPRVLTGAEITTDVVCASSANPLLFPPVDVGGTLCWDGALVGNPAIYPVIYGCSARDVVLVETRPRVREQAPATASDVLLRTMELCSSAGLVRELRAIRFVTGLVQDHPELGLPEIRLHRIPAHPALAEAGALRSFRADVAYFERLRDHGREAARGWLDTALPEGPAAQADGPDSSTSVEELSA